MYISNQGKNRSEHYNLSFCICSIHIVVLYSSFSPFPILSSFFCLQPALSWSYLFLRMIVTWIVLREVGGHSWQLLTKWAGSSMQCYCFGSVFGGYLGYPTGAIVSRAILVMLVGDHVALGMELASRQAKSCTLNPWTIWLQGLCFHSRVYNNVLMMVLPMWTVFDFYFLLPLKMASPKGYSWFQNVSLLLFLSIKQLLLPLIIKIDWANQFCNLTFCLWMSWETHAKLQFVSISRSIVESLGEIILLLGTETVKPAELELQPWEKKNASWSLDVMRGRRRCVILLLSLGS